jgi:hypothetical protein
MAIFGKKPEPTPPAIQPPLPSPAITPPQPRATSAEPAPHRPYGVAELITLMKAIPIDHHPDLVLQVVKSTLESVGVRIADIMEDATRHESQVKDRISSLEGEIDGLVQQIDRRRDLITQLRGDVTELTYAKDRWQNAQSAGAIQITTDSAPSLPRASSLPPPVPPPFPKGAPAKSSEADAVTNRS